MKAEEMGELLAGLTGSLQDHLKKGTVTDLKRLAGFLRDRGSMTIAKLIASFETSGKPGKAAAAAAKTKASAKKADPVEAVATYLDLSRRASALPVESIREEFKTIAQLTRPAIDAIAAEVGYPRAKSKKAAVAQLLDRLERKRISAQQVGQIHSS